MLRSMGQWGWSGRCVALAWHPGCLLGAAGWVGIWAVV